MSGARALYVYLLDGKDVTIFATGLMVNEALKAYEQLKQDGIDARIVNIHTIKPIDRDIIINSAKETGCIVTAEEHNYIGGLGSAVAEVVCDTVPVPVVRVGVEDQFGVSGLAGIFSSCTGCTATILPQRPE